MMLEWHEREYEDIDNEVVKNDEALEALSLCGLKKIEMNGMRAQPQMLDLLINYWNLDSDAFILDGQPLRIKVDDIYFLTGLSHRREIASFKDENIGGMIVDEYIALYYVRGTQKVGSQIPMELITILDLRVILAIIQR